MNILAFTDTHRIQKNLESVAKKVDKADVLVCAGDFTVFGSGIKSELKKINSLGKKVFLVHGNHEDEKEVKEITASLKNIEYIHKKKVVYDEYCFVGFGGDGFSFENKEFERFVKKLTLPKKKIIFVTHQPAYNTKIDFIWDHHGNNSFRKFIEKVKPVLAISGHLHETAGKQDKIGTTKVVNPGSTGKLIKV